jgi:opacity protein-like surface antigen
MTFLKSLAVGACLLCAGAPLAFAVEADGTHPARGFYIGAGGGLSWPTKMDVNVSNIPGPVPNQSGKISFDPGYVLSAFGGYKWRNGLRGELEVSYRGSTVAHFAGFEGGGRANVVSGMANVLYDIDTAFDSAFGIAPYVGAGAGISHEDWHDIHGIPTLAPISRNSTMFQWQLIGGVSLPVSSRATAFAEYRYTNWNKDNVPGPSGSMIGLQNQQSHNVLLGIRFFL